MKVNKENASMSIIKIICISVILLLISGIGVMAVNTNLNDVTIVLANGYEMTTLTSKTKVSEILEDNNIILEDDQKTVPGLDEEIKSGEKIEIKNKSEQEVQIAQISKDGVETSLDDLLKNYAPITEKIVVEEVVIPYETITKEAIGTGDETRDSVIQQGKDGLKQITYKVKYQNEVEIEKTVLSEEIIEEPVNKIVQVQNVTSRALDTSSGRSSVVSTGNGTWSYSESDMDLLCAITAQESSSSYAGALAVITTACNRAEVKGTDPLTEYKRPGQFCYSIDNYWVRRLNGNYSDDVRQAVIDALNGTRNHEYFSFRAAGYHSGELIGGNVYF
ncbi:MAG: G5 domain-containing protein [Clostridia bacterium]|nr:G5 domain-containing protein [Clostridia bacterium]